MIFHRFLDRPLRLLGCVVLVVTASAGDADTRGFKPVSVPIQGADPLVYQQSHALIIACSQYATWPKLTGVTEDARAIGEALAGQGFSVTTLTDPTLAQMRQGFDAFIDAHGMQSQNRLVVYYAGHGQTAQLSDGRQMGYLVPVDAPDPSTDATAFRSKAMDMKTVATYAERMESRHVLFVFDACFSGSIFALRSGKEPPQVVTDALAKPVRQFITSGSAGERVPDQSVFRRLFIQGIAGAADLSGDGYVTGSELGAWLFTQTVTLTRGAQNPQSGKIQNLDLNQGDIVFATRTAKGPLKGFAGPTGQIAQQPPTPAQPALQPGDLLPRPTPYDAPFRACLHLRDGRELTGIYDIAKQQLAMGMGTAKMTITVRLDDVLQFTVPPPIVNNGSDGTTPAGQAGEIGATVAWNDASWATFKPRIKFMLPGNGTDKFLLGTKFLPVEAYAIETLKVAGGDGAARVFDGNLETTWHRGNVVESFLEPTFASPIVCRGMVVRTSDATFMDDALELASLSINGHEATPIVPDGTVSSANPPRFSGGGIILVSFGGHREIKTFRLTLARATPDFLIREIQFLK